MLSLFQKEINELPIRSAMGLSYHYTPLLMENVFKEASSLLREPVINLVKICESRSCDLSERVTAGFLLGLLGDLRIDALNPAMTLIPKAEVEIGLSVDKVDDIFQKYSNLGVKKEWILKEIPRHSVLLNQFKLGKYLVTNQEWLEYLKDTQSTNFPDSWNESRFPPFATNLPVYGISKEAVEDYILWLRCKTGRSFRLPSEYEWEYAASGGKNIQFPWGDEFNPNAANTLETGLIFETPIGCFPEGCSIFGNFDMAGNVEEYVADLYRPYPGGSQINDDLTLSNKDGYTVARGGSFKRFSDLARCSRRHGPFPSPLYVIGFRLAEDII